METIYTVFYIAVATAGGVPVINTFGEYDNKTLCDAVANQIEIKLNIRRDNGTAGFISQGKAVCIPMS